jgi:hypothetical protein
MALRSTSFVKTDERHSLMAETMLALAPTVLRGFVAAMLTTSTLT